MFTNIAWTNYWQTTTQLLTWVHCLLKFWEREKEIKVTWSHTSKITSCYSKSTSNKRRRKKGKRKWSKSLLTDILYNNGNTCLDLERKTCLLVCKIPKRPHWKWRMADNHIHFIAGKDLYPEVIAVSTTASLCLTKCCQLFSSVMIAVASTYEAQAIGGQLPLHLGSGLQDAEGKIHPETPWHLFYMYI